MERGLERIIDMDYLQLSDSKFFKESDQAQEFFRRFENPEGNTGNKFYLSHILTFLHGKKCNSPKRVVLCGSRSTQDQYEAGFKLFLNCRKPFIFQVWPGLIVARKLERGMTISAVQLFSVLPVVTCQGGANA